MEVSEYRTRIVELALDTNLSDEDFWKEETYLAHQVLDVRINRAEQGLNLATGLPRPAYPSETYVEVAQVVEEAELRKAKEQEVEKGVEDTSHDET